jgi:hypothetical protein
MSTGFGSFGGVQQSLYSPALNGGFGLFQPPGSQVKTLMFQTWLTFDDSGSALISKIAPVREQIDVGKLELEELIQRDIDDHRVTAGLIPYLLNRGGTNQWFRMFPPIIAILAPCSRDGQISDAYQPVTETVKSGAELSVLSSEFASASSQSFEVTYSGQLGQGEFCAAYPVSRDENGNTHSRQLHNGRLFFRDDRTKLVIVDGQHRAMSLIALHRNIIGGWDSSNGLKYKSYYEDLWPKAQLEELGDLSSISLPMTVCLYPGLFQGSPISSEISFTGALRQTFLILNSPAVPIGSERKKLLTESDLVATCMRALAKELKSFASANRSTTSYEVYGLEIDKVSDGSIISHGVCSISVNILNKICQSLLMSKKHEFDKTFVEASGFQVRQRLLVPDSYFEKRLDFDSVFPSEEKPHSRVDFSKSQATLIEQQFHAYYGGIISKILLSYLPIEHHNKACKEVKISVERQGNMALLGHLYGGQGEIDVLKKFDTLLANVDSELPNHLDGINLDVVAGEMSNAKAAVNKHIEEIKVRRISAFLNRAAFQRTLLTLTEANDRENLIKAFDALWSQKYFSVAFQVALVLTPILLWEEIAGFPMAQRLMLSESPEHESLSADYFFDSYIESMNNFFSPRSQAALLKLLKFFNGFSSNVSASALNDFNDWAHIDFSGPSLFTEIIHATKPNSWLGYRYALLEIFYSSSPIFNRVVSSVSGGEGDAFGIANNIVKNRLNVLRNAILERNFQKELKRTEIEMSVSSPSHTVSELNATALRSTIDKINPVLSLMGVQAIFDLESASSIVEQSQISAATRAQEDELEGGEEDGSNDDDD